MFTSELTNMFGSTLTKMFTSGSAKILTSDLVSKFARTSVNMLNSEKMLNMFTSK